MNGERRVVRPPSQKSVTDVHMYPTLMELGTVTLEKEVLTGKKFFEKKIWQNWPEFNLADNKIIKIIKFTFV